MYEIVCEKYWDKNTELENSERKIELENGERLESWVR